MTWQREKVPSKPHRSKSSLTMPVAVVLAGAVGAGYFYDSLPVHAVTAMLPGSGCNIKGNISINTGERIYHVPGQRYYDPTRISPSYGERWFCSEAEARKAGWRKAHQ